MDSYGGCRTTRCTIALLRTDDEHPRESARYLLFLLASVANGAFEVSSSSWDGALRIRDNDLSEFTLTTGTVLIQDSSTGTGPEIRDTLTAIATGVSDPDGAPSGGFVFEYQWLGNGVPIPDAVGTTYVVSAADIGRVLTARVRFRDA